MVNLTRQVAARVETAIDKSGRSVLSVAIATGIPRTTLVNRLTGRVPFKVDELYAIAELLDVDLHILVPSNRKDAA